MNLDRNMAGMGIQAFFLFCLNLRESGSRIESSGRKEPSFSGDSQ